MTTHGSMDNILRRDGRYAKDAYVFLYEALDYSVRRKAKPGHISGQELLDGVRELALDKFGMMARLVFEHWGVCDTADFGEIVFNLVDEGMLKKTEKDSIEDFQGRYDFREAFDNARWEAP